MHDLYNVGWGIGVPVIHVAILFVVFAKAKEIIDDLLLDVLLLIVPLGD